MSGRRSRRRVLQLVGTTATVVLAGCSGGGDGDGGGDGAGDGDSDGNDGGNGDDTVPEQYRTATSQGGQTRNPDGLATKEALDYQDTPRDGQECAGCLFYIPDKNGDGMGACTLVEGTIDPNGWCSSYTPYGG